MARQVTTVLRDDLDGSKAAETVRFGLDGRLYEIDLNKGNAGKLRKVLARYIEGGRRQSKGPSGVSRTRKGPSVPEQRAARREELTRIREWAHANGQMISNRGRIPYSIVEAFRSAQR